MKKINIKLELDGELLDKFEFIKEKLGVKNNTEVIRVLINREFSRGG